MASYCRFYNAGSFEEFGDVVCTSQYENHPQRLQSAYGAVKYAVRYIVRFYRESYNLYAIQGWLFNHGGTLRGLDFLTRKISQGIPSIKEALEEGKEIPILEFGKLNAKKNWSEAKDFIESIWITQNQDSRKN